MIRILALQAKAVIQLSEPVLELLELRLQLIIISVKIKRLAVIQGARFL